MYCVKGGETPPKYVFANERFSHELPLILSADSLSVELRRSEYSTDTDVSGIYTDKQGTPNVYNDLTLTLQADGTYAAEIGIYRVAGLKSTAAWDGDVLRFISEDPHVVILRTTTRQQKSD